MFCFFKICRKKKPPAKNASFQTSPAGRNHTVNFLMPLFLLCFREGGVNLHKETTQRKKPPPKKCCEKDLCSQMMYESVGETTEKRALLLILGELGSSA